MYNSYEEYMQKVLGVNVPNTYMQNNDMMYQLRQYQPNMQDVSSLYPEIYRKVYPMVQKCYSMRNVVMLNEGELREMVDEIYASVEPRETAYAKEVSAQPKNGDVKNPRAKEPARPINQLLKDLIRILLINEFTNGAGRPPMQQPISPQMRPPVTQPISPQMPGMGPDMNGFNPGMQPMPRR